LSSTLIDWPPPPKSSKKKEQQSTSTQPDKKRKPDDNDNGAGVIDLSKEHGTGKRRKLNDAQSQADDKPSAELIAPASPVGDRTFHEDDEDMNQDTIDDDDPMAELSKPIDLGELNSSDVEDDLDDEDENSVDDDEDDDDDPMAELSKPINLDDIISSQEDDDDDSDGEENNSNADNDLAKPVHNNLKDMSIDPSTPPPLPHSTDTNIKPPDISSASNIGQTKHKGIPPLEKVIIDNSKKKKREKRQNITIGQERQKVRALPVLTIYLSTTKHPKLASLYG